MEVMFICLWNPWVSWNHFQHVHAYMYSLTLSQLPVMLWARNRQLSGTWLEKMSAYNTLCHILQEATIKQSVYSNCLDIETKGERTSERKSPFCQSFTLHEILLPLCAAFARKKIKGAKTKQKSRNWKFAGFLFISFLVERKSQTIIFLKLPVHMYSITWFTLFFFSELILWTILVLQLIYGFNFFLINVQMKCVEMSCQHLQIGMWNIPRFQWRLFSPAQLNICEWATRKSLSSHCFPRFHVSHPFFLSFFHFHFYSFPWKHMGKNKRRKRAGRGKGGGDRVSQGGKFASQKEGCWDSSLNSKACVSLNCFEVNKHMLQHLHLLTSLL